MVKKLESTTKWSTRWPERISYGLSDAADNLIFQMMTTYLLFFYTDVYGLTPSVVAILFVVARVADVVESFVIGVMIDHTHSRFGKSRPFFLWYSVPYVVFVTPNFSAGGSSFGRMSPTLAWGFCTRRLIYRLLQFCRQCLKIPRN